LDFGTIESKDGAQFEGYIAAVKSDEEKSEVFMVMDSGKLKLPDGRLLTGDFTIQHIETCKYTYF
jgi:hypothetical protein